MKTSDRLAAATALMEWFKSQDISPSDAGEVMSTVIATCLIQETRNPGRLLEAANLIRALLLVDISEMIKANG